MKLAQEWDRYARTVLIDVAPGSIQYIETRKGFYAGAWAVFSAQLEAADKPDHVSLALLEDLNGEFVAIRREIVEAMGGATK